MLPPLLLLTINAIILNWHSLSEVYHNKYDSPNTNSLERCVCKFRFCVCVCFIRPSLRKKTSYIVRLHTPYSTYHLSAYTPNSVVNTNHTNWIIDNCVIYWWKLSIISRSIYLSLQCGVVRIVSLLPSLFLAVCASVRESFNSMVYIGTLSIHLGKSSLINGVCWKTWRVFCVSAHTRTRTHTCTIHDLSCQWLLLLFFFIFRFCFVVSCVFFSSSFLSFLFDYHFILICHCYRCVYIKKNHSSFFLLLRFSLVFFGVVFFFFPSFVFLRRNRSLFPMKASSYNNNKNYKQNNIKKYYTKDHKTDDFKSF